MVDAILTPIRDATIKLSAAIFAFAVWLLTSVGNTIVNIISGNEAPNEQFSLSGSITTAVGAIRESDVISVASDSMKAMGYAFVCLFFLMALADLVANEQFTTELFIKSFAKFAAAFALVYFATELGEQMSSLNESFASFMQQTLSTSDLSYDEIKSNFNNAFTAMCGDNGGFWLLLLAISLLFGAVMVLAGLAANGIAMMIEITREVELIVRQTFLPLALSQWSQDGFRGGAGRYLKKYIALLCQGGALVVIAALITAGFSATGITDGNLFGNLADSYRNGDFDLGELITPFIGIIALSFGGVAVMRRSIGIINDVFGV